MNELSLNIIDIVQNSISAGAKNIKIRLIEDTMKDLVLLEVKDNGVGIGEETLHMVEDPFFTTKTEKHVGLGIPLLKETAEITNGKFNINSRKGEGTKIKATFKRSHIDLPPIGNLEDTILTLVFAAEDINLKFTYEKNGKIFEIETGKIKSMLGSITFSNPEVIKFLKEYIKENLKNMEVKNEA